MMLKPYILLLSLSAFYVVSVYGDCGIIKLGEVPIYLGGPNNDVREYILVWDNRFFDNVISVYCPGGIRYIDGEHLGAYTQKVKLHCDEDGYISYNFGTKVIQTGHKIIMMQCNKEPTESLYESQQTLPNCGNNMSYGIGYSLSPSNQFVSAAICYDWNMLTLKYVNFISQASNRFPVFMENLGLAKKRQTIDNYISITQKPIAERFNESKLGSRLNDFEFDYTSLIENYGWLTRLMRFRHIFNTIWWRNLRLGNWRRYLNALDQRNFDVPYMIYMGTSNVISVPQDMDYSAEHLTITDDSKEITVNTPAYIWAYLKPLNSSVSKDFVVIGYNSPFYDASNSKTVLCEDMCDEIDWLKASSFGKVHRMPSMGFVTCCRPEEVAAKLDNFPREALGTAHASD